MCAMLFTVLAIILIGLWFYPINGRSVFVAMRAESKLTRAKKYIQKQVNELTWNQHVGKTVDVK